MILANLLESSKITARRSKSRPMVTLSYAQSLDGSIAMRRGTPYALSGSESQIWTHKLRSMHDSILVGINTVIADNPHLTVRLVEGQSPLPIVLDSHLRLPLDANLLKNQLAPLVATTTSASWEKQEKIEEYGAKIVRTLPDSRGWVDLNSLMGALTELGVHSIMVEGGARVITSFLSQHLVDWIVITIAPAFLGGLHALENPLVSVTREKPDLNGLPEFKDYGYEQAGKDIIFWSQLSWRDR